MTLLVRVTPRGGRDIILGMDDERGRLAMRVSAPPADGAANDAVRKLVAEALDVPRGAVTLVDGARSRDKRVAVMGDPDRIAARIEQFRKKA